MKQNIILELDSFYVDRIVEWLTNSKGYDNYNIYILTKPNKHKLLKDKLLRFSNITCINYDMIFSYESDAKFSVNQYYEFINQYSNNHITARLFDRASYWPEYGIGNQNAFAHFTDVAYNALSFLKDHKIDFICFRNTPHLIQEWLLTKCIVFLNIDFYCLDDHVFPWLFTIRKGHSRDIKLHLADLDYISKKELQQHISNCVNTVSGNYEDAMPAYEKSRLGKGIFKHYNPFNEIKENILKPHRFISKSKNYLYYKKHSKTFDLKNTEYIAFFLHYQPEKTTLPDGFEFVDQFYTIKILSLLLPKHIKLLVKEHPAMFTLLSDPKFRTIHNYKSIQKLENVELVSMGTNSFDLIDNSLALATIKGTATLEAYIRKKPVIIFGDNHMNLEGVHSFSSIENLNNFIAKVLEKSIKIENVEKNLTNLCYKVTVSGITDSPEQVKDYSFSKDIRENASYKLLDSLLEKNSS
jgi:hypothetical protein